MLDFLTHQGDISLALASVLFLVSGTLFSSPIAAPVFDTPCRQPQ